jgi:hypothetical protein
VNIRAKTNGYPQDWDKYCRAVRDKTIESSTELNRFAARYRTAILFDGIHFKPGVGEDWKLGFSALLKVFLAYTAAESLQKGLEPQPFAISSTMPSLAKKLRSNSLLLDLLIKEVKPRLRPRLEEFRRKSNDVGPVAAAIRHLVAHGIITVGGAKADTIVRTKGLLDLAKAILDLCNDKFSEFCSKQNILGQTPKG